jgi:thioredoxin-related protein
MEPYAHAVMAQYRDRAVFVEKSIDHDRDAALRYGVRGSPTFVLIDASGNEIVRFGFQPTAEQFSQVIEQALTAAGA